MPTDVGVSPTEPQGGLPLSRPAKPSSRQTRGYGDRAFPKQRSGLTSQIVRGQESWRLKGPQHAGARKSAAPGLPVQSPAAAAAAAALGMLGAPSKRGRPGRRSGGNPAGCHFPARSADIGGGCRPAPPLPSYSLGGGGVSAPSPTPASRPCRLSLSFGCLSVEGGGSGGGSLGGLRRGRNIAVETSRATDSSWRDGRGGGRKGAGRGGEQSRRMGGKGKRAEPGREKSPPPLLCRPVSPSQAGFNSLLAGGAAPFSSCPKTKHSRSPEARPIFALPGCGGARGSAPLPSVGSAPARLQPAAGVRTLRAPSTCEGRR